MSYSLEIDLLRYRGAAVVCLQPGAWRLMVFPDEVAVLCDDTGNAIFLLQNGFVKESLRRLCAFMRVPSIPGHLPLTAVPHKTLAIYDSKNKALFYESNYYRFTTVYLQDASRLSYDAEPFPALRGPWWVVAKTFLLVSGWHFAEYRLVLFRLDRLLENGPECAAIDMSNAFHANVKESGVHVSLLLDHQDISKVVVSHGSTRVSLGDCFPKLAVMAQFDNLLCLDTRELTLGGPWAPVLQGDRAMVLLNKAACVQRRFYLGEMAADSRPLILLHGASDVRFAYSAAVYKFKNYAEFLSTSPKWHRLTNGPKEQCIEVFRAYVKTDLCVLVDFGTVVCLPMKPPRSMCVEFGTSTVLARVFATEEDLAHFETWLRTERDGEEQHRQSVVGILMQLQNTDAAVTVRDSRGDTALDTPAFATPRLSMAVAIAFWMCAKARFHGTLVTQHEADATEIIRNTEQFIETRKWTHRTKTSRSLVTSSFETLDVGAAVERKSNCVFLLL